MKSAGLSRNNVPSGFGPPEQRRHSKTAVVGLVLLISAIGFGVYRLFRFGHSIATESAHLQEKLRETKLRNLSKPKHSTYPIVQTFDLGADNPPWYFPLVFFGDYSVSRTGHRGNEKPLEIKQTIVALTRSIKPFVTRAEGFEAQAPRSPKRPDKTTGNWLIWRGDGIDLARYLHQIPTRPLTANLCLAIATKIVQGALFAENHPKSGVRSGVSAPSGFARYEGQFSDQNTDGPITILPVDEEYVARRMRRYLDWWIAAGRIADAKRLAANRAKPSVAAGQITIQGPIERVEFAFPILVSPQFPSSVQLVKGQEAVVEKVVAWCRDEVRRANAGAKLHIEPPLPGAGGVAIPGVGGGRMRAARALPVGPTPFAQK